jgi:maltooligosyltrehalose trehalohydrolase
MGKSATLDQEAPAASASTEQRLSLPIGAEVLPEGGVRFRVWAPRRQTVEVVLDAPDQQKNVTVSLKREKDGYFSLVAPTAKAGMLYSFRLDGSEKTYPDPVSRFQPQGVHGPSQVIDPSAFAWTDTNWKGIGPAGQVLYEMHIGTMTREGTWNAALRELPRLRDVGITCLEVMPVNEFVGRFGWGYDGVDLFAPYHHYGVPDDFRRFVDQAHAHGLAVILDLVYNHFGPDGNYLREYSEDYFSTLHDTDWGEAINFDGQNAKSVREFFVSNAVHWIREYHLDGFRFDATQAIVDSSDEHVLAVICREARKAAGHRSIYLTNENEPQDTRLVRPPAQGGYGMDALWNDDFHHSALVALSGRNEAYYMDYLGRPQELISAAKWGYLYQGQRYKWQKRRRGTATFDLPPTAFVHFIQNHDQIANSARGLRVHQITSPGQFRAMTALFLLMPQTPMLFQGQEFAASATFHYFADLNPDLAKLVCAGRAKELAQFPSVATPDMQACLLDPSDEQTFRRSQIDSSEQTRPGHAEVLRMHQDLLRLRREERAFSRVQRRGFIEGAVLGHDACVLRFFASVDASGAEQADAADRLVVVNLGTDLALDFAPEPLLAPPAGKRWAILWSSEDPRYGGSGTAPLDTEKEGWLLPGRCTVVLEPQPQEQAAVETRIRAAGSSQAAKKREKRNE